MRAVMPADPMYTVYRLDDPEQVARIQKATLETEEFGIEPTHRLVGSDEWWTKIRNHELPKTTLQACLHGEHGRLA